MPAAEPIPVVGAVIVRDGLVLCARRGPGKHLAGQWEFPGGKLEPGETAEGALVREIEEELGCRVAVGDLIVTAAHVYAAKTIVLSTYRCAVVDGEPVPTEHAEIAWVDPADLTALDWAPADLPTVDAITAAPPGR